MVFGGIQKFTLLDYPERTACTLFTIGCNFRCPFCQNTSLIESGGIGQPIDEREIIDFLKTRIGLLDGICISGGEPLLCPAGDDPSKQDGLLDFISKVKSMGFLIKLDTNGSYPNILNRLISSGFVDYISMDIKNTRKRYAETIGIPDYDIYPVTESVDIILLNKVPYEFRTTVVREFHTLNDLLEIAARISGAEKYFLQKFVDSGGVLQKGLTGYSDTEMHQFIHKIKEILPSAELRGTL